LITGAEPPAIRGSGVRNPVNAARTLCACHLVALVSSLIGAPSGRCSRATMIALFDFSTEGSPAPTFEETGDVGGFISRFWCSKPHRGLRCTRFTCLRHGLNVFRLSQRISAPSPPRGRLGLRRRPRKSPYSA